MGNSNKTILILVIIVGFLFFIFVGLAGSYYASNYVLNMKNSTHVETEPNSVSSQDVHNDTLIFAEKKKEEEKPSHQISVETYIPTDFDNNANASYYIVLKNIENKHYEGSFEIKNIQTQRNTDKVGYIKLDPHEAKLIPCMGSIPDKESIDLSLDGKFSDVEYQMDSSLDYTIVSKEVNNPKSKTGSMKLFIYVAPNESDDSYLAICKEIKNNYDTSLIIADFSPVMINPTKNDTRITFAQNKVMRFSHVLFYTTDTTNIHIQEMERRIVDI